ncbi:MAG TPA: pentapeptide repeat-containing protein [Saprospiraceae bacterium]|nr:pentapeptide repeat-containing protein [Saprospiraceae bacterium]
MKNKIIKNQNDFLNRLNDFKKKEGHLFAIKVPHDTIIGEDNLKNDVPLLIKNIIIKDKILYGIDFISLQFEDCTFYNINFQDFTSTACNYINCKFLNCDIADSGFYECDIVNCEVDNNSWYYVNFADTTIKDLYFNNCDELLEIYFGGCKIDNVTFKLSTILHSRFEPLLLEKENNHFRFLESRIYNCNFLNIVLNNSIFKKCVFEQAIFSNCTFSKNTIERNNTVINKKYCSIDLQSIKASEIINKQSLANVFGIFKPNIKEIISELTNITHHQSVFISYSFKDKVFANKLNNALRERGIFTFLWEKDAPGGKPLRKIMSESIHKFDRILFIASENSIKSKACQFELTEGRKKQENLWQTIFFPIHIDNYVFEVDKEDLRPRDKTDEYWLNILELREINSIDFSDFKKNNANNLQFHEKINLLFQELKK